jgi:hypothetical protein
MTTVEAILKKLPAEMQTELEKEYGKYPKSSEEFLKWSVDYIYRLLMERDKGTITDKEYHEVYYEFFYGYVPLQIGSMPRTLTDPKYQRRFLESLGVFDKTRTEDKDAFSDRE